MQRHENRHLYTAISEGDEGAFATFYSIHFDRLATAVLCLLKNKAQAEEVLQDVFCTVWNRRAEICSILNMEAYLFVLARNAALNRIKVDVRRKKVEQDFFAENSPNFDFIDTTSDQHRFDKLLDEAIAQLPLQQKRVFVLSRFERKKYLEIATDMEISRETVKKYLQLASTSVKNYLLRRKDSVISLFLAFFIF
ncbi:MULTISPECIES: RNA polymerase sigma factor [Sphingobacterium]|uniref:RNA polymerase sigma factor n=1 Tax=Sphingobacterium TaxID=28453 RepID=UPI0013D928C7|nr:MULTISPECIES: sigma-70 family RNA polymerase sigma factor [unclassified Sphingobacterium]